MYFEHQHGGRRVIVSYEWMNKWMKSREWEDNCDVWLLFLCHYSLPQGLGDVTTFPDLIAELLKRGYSDEDVKKVVGENLIRTFKKAEEVYRWVKCFSSLRETLRGALAAGREKEGELATTSLEFKYLHRKVRRWH